MSLMVRKVLFNKQKPKIIQYGKYKYFSNETFMHELESALSIVSQVWFGTSKITVDNIFQKRILIKKRYVRANQPSFMINKIHKEVMRRRRLRNKFKDPTTDADKIAYKKQHNYCVILMQKEKRPIKIIWIYLT